MLNRCQNSTSEVVAHYSLNVGSGDVELNVPDVLKVRRVCHSPVRQQSGGEGMELGGGGLLRGNPQPVLPLVLHIIQEVESVRRREPARGNEQKNKRLTAIPLSTKTHNQLILKICKHRMTCSVRSWDTHASSSLSGIASARDGYRANRFAHNDVSHGSITASALVHTHTHTLR